MSRQNYRRKIDNEPELVDVLNEFGFVVVYPENLSILQQILLFSSAEIIVGAYGAALCNCVFMKPGGVMVELCSSEWEEDGRFMNFAATARMKYVKIVGENQVVVGGNIHSNYKISKNVLNEILSKLIRKI